MESLEDLRGKLDSRRGECIKIQGGKRGEVAGLGVENKPVIKTKNTASFGSRHYMSHDESSLWFSLIAQPSVCPPQKRERGLGILELDKTISH